MESPLLKKESTSKEGASTQVRKDKMGKTRREKINTPRKKARKKGQSRDS